MTDADLFQALRDCYHPVLRRNIVELDMVRSATLTPDPEAPPFAPHRYTAHLTLLAPGADETATAHFTAQIENRLLGLESISHVEIKLLPPSSPSSKPFLCRFEGYGL